jgi:hypothetical protein
MFLQGFIAQELDIAQTEAEVEWLKLVLKENQIESKHQQEFISNCC